MRLFRLRLNRNVLLLLAAIAAGLAAAWFARRYIQDHIRALDEQAKVRTVSRIVADFDLPEGLRLERLHLAVMPVPVNWVPSGSIAPEEVESIEGKLITTAVRKGDILLRANLAPQRHQAFSQKIRTGRRAVTIPVDAINSVSGMLVPGDLIDLYVSFEYRRKRITAPLLQGVLVLATGSDSRQTDAAEESGQSTAFSTVTLDTAPEEAARLVAARQAGTITALLRHPDDARASNKGVQGDLATLLGIAKPVSVTRKRPTVIYGNQPQHRLPALSAESQPGVTDQSKGLFELPDTEDIVSAWINSLPAVRTSDGTAPAVSMGAKEEISVTENDIRDRGAAQVQSSALAVDVQETP
ncbi:putative Flp pilus assembly protein CpaB [Advenella mimigardefordensis DPN7]|uniref:Putative Flp pilus assembly protein CpaB n=1 Tax=Advenella mimigardefordensis (strain DSM 17166 / LMG 22922 / DPN7) TaxID=1247726 RepID=W0PA57_ADVMD|nr:putative Flp pilus assembly protein CpaB [Advenella mimigardefordensis DPN7]